MTQQQPKITYRDPVLLSVHPALKHFPAAGEEELKVMRAGLARSGELMEPILTDEQGLILNDSGRSLWLCAKARQLKEVPVCVWAGDVHVAIVKDLTGRRHLSKSAIAYLAVPHLQPALEAARARRLENLRKNPDLPEYRSIGIRGDTMEGLAEELGISSDLLSMAVRVHKEFESKKLYAWTAPGTAEDGAEATFKDWYEPKLLRAFVGGEHESRRPFGLGGILAGIEAKKKDPADFAPKPKQADFLADLFTDHVQKFVGMPVARQAKALEVIRESAEKLEPAECAAAAVTLRSMAKIYDAVAKKTQVS